MGVLYASSFSVFLVLVLILGGGAAWATGRAVAITWRPLPVLAWFIVLLTLAVRFLSFALFEEPLLSAQYFLVDYVVLGAIALLGWRLARTTQMTTQYVWLYEKTSPFSWRLKAGQEDRYADS
ncbi:hypothetical protein J0X15_06775 [Roseibium sp. CAU 1637]|uniref:DUF6867 domain-containing protein n=1 Tax=Roseibium limicola TaxID=2816037 RepID=A0A939EP29_9HYPH|nr:hypothetical protein [Roseibium limicola]MBO0344913.1 hypothetical protein [Roseibium limicola]